MYATHDFKTPISYSHSLYIKSKAIKPFELFKDIILNFHIFLLIWQWTHHF